MYNCISGKRISGLLLWISFFPPNWISCIIYHNQARVARTRLVVLSRGEYSGSPATKVGVHFLNTKLSWSFSLFRFTTNNLHCHLLKHFLRVPFYGMMTHWAMSEKFKVLLANWESGFDVLRCCWPRWLVGDTSCESTATVLETPLLEISPTVGKGGIQFGIQDWLVVPSMFFFWHAKIIKYPGRKWFLGHCHVQKSVLLKNLSWSNFKN